MALTKVSTGMLSADVASIDLNIDANTMYIDVSNNRVGINNAAPSTALDVSGTVTADGLTVANTAVIAGDFDGGTAATYIRLQDDTDNFLFGSNNSLGNFLIKNETADALRLSVANTGDVSFYEDTGTTPKFFWDASAQRLGLGTTSALADLHIVNSTAAQFLLEAGDSSTATILFGDSADTNIGWIQYDNSDNNMNFRTNNTERMRILADGSVVQGNTVSLVASNYNNQAGAAWHKPDGHYEIATTSNVAPLQIGKNNANDGTLVTFRKQSSVVGSISSRGGVTLGLILNPTSGVGAGLSGTSNAIFPVDETTTPVNDQISLGTTSNAFKNLYLSGGMQLSRAVTSETEIESYNNTDSGGAKYKISFKQNGTQVGVIEVGTSSTAYLTSSDYRLKENVAPLTSATERLKQLNPSRFNFIADADTTVDGFLAHEVQDVVPEAISGTKDAMRDEEYEVTPAVLDDDGNVVTEAVMGTRSVPDYQGIDQSKLVPLLVATIQELEARIAALES